MTGTAGERLEKHVRRPFVTYDQEDYWEKENLAVKYHGGWWYTTDELSTRYIDNADDLIIF